MQSQIRSLSVERCTTDPDAVLPGESHERLPGLRGQTLPVLAAIQQFLEAERRRTRRRMWALTAFFALLLLCVCGIGLAIGIAIFTRMAGDIQSMQTTLKASRDESATLCAAAERTLAAVTNETAGLRQRLAEGQGDLGAVRSNVASQASANGEALRNLQETLRKMEDRNQTLRHDLDAMQSRLVARAAKPVPVSAPVAAPVATPAAELPRAEPGVPQDIVPAPIARKGPQMLTLSITPPGSNRAAKWRLLIPE
jgi:cell division protein FtsB